MTNSQSASHIITTFNHFFATVPADKSFDMTYKAYMQDLADVEDRKSVGQKSICLASFGSVLIPNASSSTSVDLSAKSSKSSDTSVPLSDTNWSVTMSQVDRICADNMARKQRSMVNLTEFNKKLGLPFDPPPPAAPSPDTVYENVPRTPLSTSSASSSSTSSNFSSSSTLPFSEPKPELGKVIESKKCSKTKNNIELFVRVADCFD